ncbi:hypothetical protein RB2150_03893 [Rhodobacterales bacterium HTCC2150]|nr:hypothetical protein RB2150_03893 [Rhodobacterales bacterium HTCC2150] [Rhodobacteraceae bacterium HTCC2150]
MNMKDKKMDPVDLPLKFTDEILDEYLNPPNAPRRSLTSAVISPIYNSANAFDHTAQYTGHQERTIRVVLPISPEIEEAADGFSLKHHLILACKDVVRNKEFYHG